MKLPPTRTISLPFPLSPHSSPRWPHLASQSRKYAKSVDDAPSFFLTRRSTETRKEPPKLPAKQLTDLPAGAHRRERPQAIAFGHLMKRPTEGMRSPFADEAMRVSEDWKALYATCSSKAFDKDIAEKLAVVPNVEDVEVRAGSGLVYLKREKYQAILDSAFGFAGWHLIPRGPLTLSGRTISRPFALLAHNRFIAEARGDYQPPGNQFPSNPAADETVNKALEYAALVRCCKDLGVATELWDPKRAEDYRKKAGKAA